ncbi:MAG: aspartate kinase, partial [Bacteroidota bacterium]
MQIFKFGGASVKDAAGVKNLSDIVSLFNSEEVVVVVSAMGKTTNKLEELVKKACRKEKYDDLLSELKAYHHEVIKELLSEFPERYVAFEKSLEQTLQNLNEDDPMLAYDQVVPHGELMSTSIIEAYLSQSVKCGWFDARTAIRTDQYFTEANVDWVVTEKQVLSILKPLVKEKVIVTQGFIGSDVEGNTTTLGREGSDYTGAILAYCLNADGFTVWKDVPGILNADPRILDNTEQYEKLSYREVTEMTYYG